MSRSILLLICTMALLLATVNGFSFRSLAKDLSESRIATTKILPSTKFTPHHLQIATGELSTTAIVLIAVFASLVFLFFFGFGVHRMFIVGSPGVAAPAAAPAAGGGTTIVNAHPQQMQPAGGTTVISN